MPIFAKGTNYVPADVFPERTNNDSVINNLLVSAKKVHMNTIRVWGGGVYESDEFYKVIYVHYNIQVHTTRHNVYITGCDTAMGILCVLLEQKREKS